MTMQTRSCSAPMAFGKFGALDVEEPWLPEARRYFIGIVGKYGVQVQARAEKGRRAGHRHHLPPARPRPAQGAAGRYAGRRTTSGRAYRPESDGMCSSPTAASTATLKTAAEPPGAEALTREGRARDGHRARTWPAATWPRPSRRTLSATASWYWPRTTYNADVFPFMKEFIHHLTERNYQNRTVGLY